MASMKITDGVFAVNKPAGISSAQVLRELQKIFKPSKFFAEALEEERTKKNQTQRGGKKWRRGNRNKDIDVKIGHGGTLDPMATGVLIAGVGKGTKALHGFTVDCTKQYEAIALFGCSTDTYDVKGKIVERTPYSHITRDLIENALPKFRGNIMQKPPIYSALHVNGMRLYEYAREGKPLPFEIKSRPVNVESYEILKFVPGFGSETHSWQYPTENAPEQEKVVAKAMEALVENSVTIPQEEGGSITSSETKEPLDRKRPADLEETVQEDTPSLAPQPPAKKLKTETKDEASPCHGTEPASTESGGEQLASVDEQNQSKSNVNVQGFHEDTPPAAVHLRMTVSSGTYVRSLIHDLGKALGSSAIMVSLVRTRQGEFELGKNVIEWDTFTKEDGGWEAELEQALKTWNSSHVEK